MFLNIRHFYNWMKHFETGPAHNYSVTSNGALYITEAEQWLHSL